MTKGDGVGPTETTINSTHTNDSYTITSDGGDEVRRIHLNYRSKI